jgi:hypothetical protein
LPLLLVAAMVAIGAGIELALDGRWTWRPELPLLALLALAFARRGRSGGSARPGA